MPDQPSPSPPECRASLRSGELETRYRRAGAGSPVLLLAGPGSRDSVPAQLFRSLSERFRVVWPGSPRVVTPTAVEGAGVQGKGSTRPVSTAVWLRGLVDGLGLGRCAVVAERSFCLPAVWFALSDPLRVARLVLLVPEALDAAAPIDAVCEPLIGAGQSILLVRTAPVGTGDRLPEDVLTRVSSFLAAASDPAELHR